MADKETEDFYQQLDREWELREKITEACMGLTEDRLRQVFLYVQRLQAR